MARPINELAQRMDRCLKETTSKLDVLSHLNQEFFEDIRSKKDEATLVNYFGGPLGRLLWRHALIEERFAFLSSENGLQAPSGEEEGVEVISEEMRACMNTLSQSTQLLIRQFSKPENRYRLQEFRGEFKMSSDNTELG